jgi:hypothetical protein
MIVADKTIMHCFFNIFPRSLNFDRTNDKLSRKTDISDKIIISIVSVKIIFHGN